MVDGLVQKITVVRDDQKTPLEGREIILQHVQRHDVQIVRRLVEDQEVGVAHEYGQQIEPPPLAAAQDLDMLGMGLGREEKTVEHRHGRHGMAVGRSCCLGYLLHHVEDRLPRAERHALLAVVSYAEGFAAFDCSRVGCDGSREEVEEGTLAHAVLADDTDTLVTRELVREVVEHAPLSEVQRYILAVDDLASESRRGHVYRHGLLRE